MTDLRRLGKRGSYRLGRLGAPSAAAQPPRVHYPAFRPARRGRPSGWLAAGLAATVLVAAGASLGWWFVPFLVGLVGGLASRYGRLRLPTAAAAMLLVAAVGWAVPLAWAAAAGLPVRKVAAAVAALAGLPAHASVIIAVTLLVAVLQASAGLWVGRALGPRPAR
jgi:hypothetical protein